MTGEWKKYEEYMPENCDTRVESTQFQAIFKEAVEVYQSLPWYKRLFGVPFAKFEDNDKTFYKGAKVK